MKAPHNAGLADFYVEHIPEFRIGLKDTLAQSSPMERPLRLFVREVEAENLKLFESSICPRELHKGESWAH